MKTFKKGKISIAVIATALTMLFAVPLAACDKDNGDTATNGEFNMISDNRAAVIYVEGTNAPGSTDGDYPGVVRAAYDLQSDVEKITGVKPVVSKKVTGYTDYAVIVGTIGKSENIAKIINNKKIDVSSIENKWESYIVKTVQDPFNDGRVKTALVIAGSDKRGSIYGIYSVSEQLGMTPWNFFADSIPGEKENLVLAKDYISVGKEPDVKYRGIFINDEECLEQWARVLDEGAHLGPNLYEKIFEMLLRVRANYLWPGMHLCSDAFSDYAENPVNADYYGIVIGTSHCDMLLRNNINEWDSFKKSYASEHGISESSIEYDFTVNPDIVCEYWRRSVEANKDYEVQWTLGMRGAHDEGLNLKNINNAPWYGDKVMLMEQIFEAQREILRDVLNNPTLEDVFMMFIPYKEVQQIYNDGLTVPEDVTIMWADDNHGFIRNLPNETERERSGGHGIYYHNSYWGPDNESYMWINSMPMTMVYEEMNKAYDYGVRKAWVLNSGDTVPYMPEIEFFVDLGYDMQGYTHENVYEKYMSRMATREFGAEFAEDVTRIMKEYTLMTNSRKLEQMSVDIFSQFYNDESEKRASRYERLWELAERIYGEIPERQKDCYYETVLFEVRCAYFINAEFYYAHKGNVAYEQGRNSTAFNCYNLSKEFNQKRKDEISYYNNILAGGKWKNLVDPEVHHSPPMSGFANGSPAFITGTPSAGVVVEGEYEESANSVLSFGNYAKGRKYIDIFNRGAGEFDFAIAADKPFIKLSAVSGTVTDETRIWAEIDWSKVSSSAEGTITITAGEYTKTVTIKAIVDNFNVGEKTYIEQDGYVSIEAEHYSAARNHEYAYWTTIKDLGRNSGDMVRAETKTLVGYNEISFKTDAPYLEYNVYFKNTGEFNAEVYRLPTLSSLGRVRFAVQLGDGEPVILEGENDYGTNNPLWEEGVFTQIIKHKLKFNVTDAGLTKIRIYMIDPYITIDKMVIYTDGMYKSYFGPDESYNTTFNTNPAENSYYESFYQSKYVLPENYDIARNYGDGYFVETDGKISIEAESAAIEGTGVSITNGRWMVARTIEGISMRTEKLRDDFHGRWETEAPAMNYEIIISNPGNYNVWVCLNSPMPRSSVYAIGVDNVYKFLQSNFAYDREETFVWRKAGTQLSFSSAGKYTLNFYCSQDALSVDKIYLTKTGETPDSASFVQSARTCVWTGAVADSKADGALRAKLSAKIDGIGNFYNVITGTELGEYGTEEYGSLINAIDEAYVLVNSVEAISEEETNAALSALDAAYNALIASRNLNDGTKDYILYETYDKAYTGLAPFGFKFNSLYLSPDVSVTAGAEGNFFNIRTFNEQKNTEKAFAEYSLGECANNVTAEARISFNEAEWGSFYLLNESGENSVCVAFEYAYNRYNIVAYNRNSKTVIASYERNVAVDLKIVADVENNVFDVYVNGEKVAEEFGFRKNAESLTAVMFGSAVANADLRVYSLKAYKEEA